LIERFTQYEHALRSHTLTHEYGTLPIQPNPSLGEHLTRISQTVSSSGHSQCDILPSVNRHAESCLYVTQIIFLQTTSKASKGHAFNMFFMNITESQFFLHWRHLIECSDKLGIYQELSK